VTLFVIFATLARGSAEDAWTMQIARLVIFVLAAASAVGAWGTAVAIASVHKVLWPLVLTSAGVCGAAALVVVRHALAR
jgi:hypothetical protein